jgi:hypothetical protein
LDHLSKRTIGNHIWIAEADFLNLVSHHKWAIRNR